MQNRLLERLGDTQTGEYVQVGYYTPQEAGNWLNAAQRLFVLLTLCLETTEALVLTVEPPTAFYSMMSEYADWLVPLRVRVAGGAKLLPKRLVELAAYDASWNASAGFPVYYSLSGFDLLGVYQQPEAAMSLDITYAQCPPLLINPTDVPAIPDEYHPELIEGAIPLCRAKEGGAEWQKTLKSWNRFLDSATRLGDFVRARNRELGYDRLPAELRRFDRSKMLEAAAK